MYLKSLYHLDNGTNSCLLFDFGYQGLDLIRRKYNKLELLISLEKHKMPNIYYANMDLFHY